MGRLTRLPVCIEGIPDTLEEEFFMVRNLSYPAILSYIISCGETKCKNMYINLQHFVQKISSQNVSKRKFYSKQNLR